MMDERIEMARTDFEALADSMAVAAACTSLLPGEEPPPNWIPPDEEACAHWLEAVAVTRAADRAIDRALVQQRLADSLGPDGGQAALAATRADLAEFVGDLC